MRAINTEELKRIELDLLCQVDQLCRQNGLRYTLAYGTLLGAVRHKGFIPWDDDIDIAMPRKDYEALIDLCLKTGILDIVDYRDKEWYSYPFAKAEAPYTVIEEENTKHNGHLGIYIDIFPIDALGHNEEVAKKHFIKTEIKRDLVFAACWKKYFRSNSRSALYEPVRFVFYFISRFIMPKKTIKSIEDYYKKFVNDDEYVGCIYTPYRIKDVMRSEIYSDFIELEFEGKQFYAISKYDEYLTTLYGDYMKYPPVEKQISHHMFKAWIK